MKAPPTVGRALVTTLGLGLLRPASGTWGSIPPVAVAAVLGFAGYSHTWVWWASLAAIIVLFSWACVEWGDWAEANFGKKDPGQVVADETAGMALTLLFLPGDWHAGPARFAGCLLAAFLLFRMCDIVKPPPIRGLQRFTGGWGILLDDLGAGLLAGLLLMAGLWATRT